MKSEELASRTSQVRRAINTLSVTSYATGLTKSADTEELGKNHDDFQGFKSFFEAYPQFEYKAYECAGCGARFAWYKWK